MALSGLDLFTITERFTALTVLLQSLEWLQVRAAFADDGVWRYAALEPEQRRLPFGLPLLCRLALPYRRFVGLLGLRCLAAGLVLGWGVGRLWPLLCMSQILVCIRFRGASNGGSDALSVVLLSALSVPALFGRTALAAQAAMLYIGVQVTLSYLIAGLAKLRQPDWRSGRALAHFVSASPYGVSGGFKALLARPGVAVVLSWCVIGFECLFPLAWIERRACLTLLACGLAFHVGNLVVFGLNRFFWTWAAGYPAVLACCELVTLLCR